MGILFGLLAALMFGVSLVTTKKSYDTLAPSVAFAFQAFFGLLIWIPFALFQGVTFSYVVVCLFVALMSAVFSEAFPYYILSKASAALTGAFFSTYPVFTILFSVMIIRERPPIALLPFLFAAVVGIVVLSLPNKFDDKADKRRALFWGLLGALAVGLSDTLSKGVIDKTSAATFIFSLSLMQIPVALVFLSRQNESFSQFAKVMRDFGKYFYAATGAMAGAVGVLFMWLAFELTSASIASPLTATYPAFAAVLAYVWLKERLSKMDALGIATIVIGIMGIGYFS